MSKKSSGFSAGELQARREEALERILADTDGIDRLRRLVRAFDSNNEGFNDERSVADLLLIHDAWRRSEWDIYPDDWEDQQVVEALGGRAPTWNEREQAIYGEPHSEDIDSEAFQALATVAEAEAVKLKPAASAADACDHYASLVISDAAYPGLAIRQNLANAQRQRLARWLNVRARELRTK